MRYLILLSALTLAACSSAPSHELPQTSNSDPTWQLNEGKWTFNENALVNLPASPTQPPASKP
jgi:ABC-type transporter lipoprotein component MlaA